MGVKGYKAFNKGMICNGKQYAENTVYEESGGEICGPGMMHFCKDPMDVLEYYPLVDDNGDFSEFAEVEALSDVVEQKDKCATKKLKIGAKLSFKDFIRASIDVLIEKTKPGKVKSDADLSNNGRDNAQIGSSGYEARIGSSGNRAQIGSSGNWAQIGSSGDEARIGSSGDDAQIGSSGDEARIGSSGDEARIKMTGKRSVGAAVGYDCMASGKNGDWIVLAEWKQDKDGLFPACVRAGQIDGKALKEDVMYKLAGGEFVEAKE